VVTAPAVAKDVPIYIDEIGKITAREHVVIRPQVSGKIMAIKFVDGADVKKGDALFEIDPRPFQASLNQAKATLAQNRANVLWTENELKRVQGLKGTGAVTTQEVEQKQNAVEVAEAQVDNAKAAVQTAQLNLEYCDITSPIDGRTGQRLVDVGNVVNSSGPDGGSELLTIQRIKPIYADFTIPEQELSRVREQMGKSELKTQAWLPGQADKPREGTLTFLDNAVQAGSGTVKLRATLANEDAHFWPGQFANVRLVLEVKKGAVLVPALAQQIGQEGPYVYVVRSDKTAELRKVQVGQRQGEMLVVDKGLEAGETVVVEGQMGVVPGGPVNPMPQTAPNAAPPAVAQSESKS
jgi:multidrug efflux system membrane fusion protein